MRGGGLSRGILANEYRAQINFVDLTPYLTYDFCSHPVVWRAFQLCTLVLLTLSFPPLPSAVQLDKIYLGECGTPKNGHFSKSENRKSRKKGECKFYSLEEVGGGFSS